jgi:uncharacterized protein with FMN-binding domain
MRRIVIALATTATGLVLLFSWPTSTNRSAASGSSEPQGTTGADTVASGTDPSSGATPPKATGTGTTGPGGTAANPPAASGTRTYDGSTTMTCHGPVQVRITVTDGALTDSKAITFPHGSGEDRSINARAVPILNSEATRSGSANIDMVSGATCTSQGYISSLQDALDQAGL